MDRGAFDSVGIVVSSAAALGAGLLTAWALAALGDLAGKPRPFVRPRISLRAALRAQEEGTSRRTSRRARELLPYATVPLGIALALLARDLLLSPYLAIAGVALALYLRSKRDRADRSALTGQVKALVLLYRSRYAVGESPFAVLADVAGDLPEGQIRRAVERTTEVYRARGDGGEALAVMRDMRHPFLSRLVMVLGASPSAETEAILAELRGLEDDLKSRDRLAGQAKATLALLKGTVSFLQVANLTAIAACMLLPLWHDFFTSTLQRRGTFLAATTFLLIASLYFDQEIALQEDKLL